MPLDNKGILADVSIPPVGTMGRYNDIAFLYSGGFYLSGYNGDTLWANAQATASRTENYIPGNVDSNQYDPRYKIYIIKKSDPAFGYEWQQWKFAVNLGADFYDGDGDGDYDPIDLNGNGTWDPSEDRPDIIGDQIAWCVFNDGDTIRIRFMGIPPLGIEIYQTVFGYKTYYAPQLKNVLFVRYKILNTGKINSMLDSVYFTAWADADMGAIHNDDLVGCDTLVNSGYTYNKGPDGLFGDNPPAFFVNLLQGPYTYIPGETFIDNNGNGTYEDSIDTPLDTAYNHQGPIKGIEIFPGARNQKMTSYNHNMSSAITHGDPFNEFEARNYMLGLSKVGEIIDPCSWYIGQVRGGVNCSLVNPFYLYSGDPETDYGWINILATDHRTLINTGPFSLEMGKPITIIVGYTIGQGNDPLNSVTEGKIVSEFVQQFYQSNFDDNILPVEDERELIVNEFRLFQNYPNPFNPTTKIIYSVPQSSEVIVKVFDILGNEIVTLVNEEKPIGTYTVDFNASNLPSGIYFYQLQTPNFTQTKKMILLK
jgi:hypothetical protein